MTHDPEDSAAGYEPRYPTLAATGFFTLWVAILSLPMLAGQWLAKAPWSDQYAAGYAFRTWGVEQLKRTGHIPLWNPEMFGGLPFVAALHGDIFYPTSWLRLLWSMPTVMNLGFVIHYVAAGLFTYLLLRRLSVPWIGAVVAGIGYELSGLIASYPLPGHDGKLFVSTLLPLSMLALVLALKERRWSGYALLALSVGLALLSPHFQLTYYMLIAAGLFALYLTFGERTDRPLGTRLGSLALALGAVVLGFGLSAIQVLPFVEYLPFSPRAQGFHGFEGATSFAVPWVHVPEFFLKRFTGLKETYWGPNGLKLHSEYLGLPVIALAVLGVGAGRRRRLVLWLGGIGLLFLLVSLGAATPFYQVWWALMPYVKATRAPGMAFYVVALVVAIYAGLGAARLEQKEGAKHVTGWFVAGGGVLLLAAIGAFGSMALSWASSHEAALGLPLVRAAQADQGPIQWGAATSGLALGLAAAIALAWLKGRVPGAVFGALLVCVIGTDLWLNARAYWVYSPAPPSLFKPDPITQRLKATPYPYRVLDPGVYPPNGAPLMAFDAPEVLGHHGFELNTYDQLLGGQNQWANLRYVQLLDLLAVRYVVWPTGEQRPDQVIPGFSSRYRAALTGVTTSSGAAADLYERTDAVPYARVVPAAIKAADEQIVPALMNPRLDYSRLVLLTPDAPVVTPPLESLPPPLASRATVTTWEPGAMTVRLDPVPEQDAYVVVSENWYPDWHATVDGHDAPVLRGQYTLLTVPVPRGAHLVRLKFASRSYQVGKGLTLASLAGIVFLLALPLALRRRGG